MIKPKIAFLGVMQELYDNMYPDITERQNTYAKNICKELSDIVDLEFIAPARNQEDIEKHMAHFEQGEYDGLMIVMLTYSPGLRLVRALQKWDLPILLANIQPLQEVTDEWDMSHLTFNQGIHGAQDTANTLLRLNKNYIVVTGDWHSKEFKQKIATFSSAAKAVKKMKDTKIAVFGQMPGMGDILINPHTFMQQFGTRVDHCNIGLIAQKMDKVQDKEIKELVTINHQNFDIDPKLTLESEQYACRFQIAVEQFLEENKYNAWSMYFDQPGLDGRFKQIHIMAASNLMAKGVAFAGEGDSTCTALMSAGYGIADNAHFTEMYAMDFEKNSILMSHMGEGNWKIARKDRKPKLIDRPLGIGGLDNPPTILFQGEPGPATLVSLAPVANNKFNLVVSYGEILDTPELPNLEMPYFHFSPKSGLQKCLCDWLENGGTHHQVLHLGDHRETWEMFAKFIDVNYIEV